MRSAKRIGFITFFLIAALISVSWFRDKLFYGGAEVGLFTYHTQRWLEISRYIWWDAVFPGQLIPHFISGVPLYFIFYVLNLAGLSPQHIQQLTFFILLFLMGFGMFHVLSSIFEDDKKKFALFGGLFYMFNAYTLIQVWHRFLYVSMFLAAVLPILILFWGRWIKEGKIADLAAFLLVNLLFSYMYGNLASVVTIWLALLLLTLTEIFFPWQGRVCLNKIGFKFLAGLFFWFLTNLWWIAPTFLVGPGLLSQQHNSEDNLGTLVAISRQTIMPYLLQLVNPYYLFYQSELGSIYSNIAFKIIPWIMSAVIFVGLFFGLKSKNYAKYGVIFLVFVLLSKGAAPPFSFPYIFGFEHFYFLGVLRNPFEKLGILLPLFGAVLFTFGLQILFTWIHARLGTATSKFALFLILAALIGFSWPMFAGGIFGTKKLPVEVSIPESYQEADQWLKEQRESEGIILHLPFSGKDVVTYNWSIPYHGVDQNEILFSTLPSLSRSIGIKRIDDTLDSLTYIFTSPLAKDKKQILKILQNFNVKYIVLHKDIKWQDQDTYGKIGELLNPEAIESVLDNLEFLKKERQFGQLVIYKLRDENYQQALKISDDFQVVYPGSSKITQILSLTNDQVNLVTPVSDKFNEEIFQKAKQELIFPDEKIDYFESLPSAMIAKTNDMFNQLLQIRQYFYSLGDLTSEEISKDLISATEMVLKLSSPYQLMDYEKLMKKIFSNYSQDLNIHRLFSPHVAYVLRFHLFALNQVGVKSDVTKLIERNAEKLGLIPRYKIYGQIFKFSVPSKGDFELLLPDSANVSAIRVNGENIAGTITEFKQGSYEIGYQPQSQQQADDIVLRLKKSVQPTSSPGEILSFEKQSPTSYSGKMVFRRSAFLIFAQAYHPEWILTLKKANLTYQVKDHLMSNLYGNAWWVKEAGEYDFWIEFRPQRNVGKGSVGAAFSYIFLFFAYYMKAQRRK